MGRRVGYPAQMGQDSALGGVQRVRTTHVRLMARHRSPGKGPARRARRDGWVPAILYGNGAPGMTLMVPQAELRELLGNGGRGSIFDLAVEGEKRPRTVLLKELQFDNLNGRMVHADFQEVDPYHAVRLQVPIRFRGEELLTRKGYILEHQVPEVELEGRPADLPEAIWLDVSGLEPGEHIEVRGLPIPVGVRVHGDPHATVVLCLAPEQRLPEMTVPMGEAAVPLQSAEGGPR